MTAPPRPLDGEKSEMKPNFFLYTADIEHEGKKMKKFSFWNATSDTQFRATFTFGDPNPVTKLSDDVQEKEGGVFVISLYPGEAKEFAQGSFKSLKKGLAFGTPDKAYQEKMAAATCALVDEEMQAMRAALKANPSKDGRYTADYISAVALKEGIPFVDLTFPPKASSLYRDFEEKGSPLANKVLPWKRPGEYCKDPNKHPALFVGKIEPSDIDQGELGDCYLLCALACIAEFPAIIRKLLDVPREPELGMYRTRLCKNGWWTNMTVDDLLPMKGDKPIFAKNREEPNELWVSIMEKSIAKGFGSYEAIRKGDAALAVADFVGVPYLKFKDHPSWEKKDDLFKELCKWDQEEACMTLGTPGFDPKNSGANMAGDAKALAEKYEKVGLVTGHAFSLIAAKEFKGHKLVKIRNPWSGSVEWNGKYSDSDAVWTPELKKAFGWSDADDGTFWMANEDVWKWFESGSVSHLKCLQKWSSVRLAGNFDKGVPDVVIKVTTSGLTKPTQIIAGLHQKDTRGLRPEDRDVKYKGVMISVLSQEESGKVKVVDKSNASYVIVRDLFCDSSFEKKPASEPYFILPQCYSEDDKSFVLSLFMESTVGIDIEFVGYKEGMGKKINNGALFVPSNCNQKVAAQIQYVTPDLGGDWLEAESNTVDFAGAKKALAAKTPLPGRLTNDVDLKRMDSRMSMMKKWSAKAPKSSANAPGSINVNVTCISGTGLESKDPNGKSDPYLVVAVKDKTGKVRGDIEAQSTKYVTKTLEPCWGEMFTFEGVMPEDTFYVQCFDKDFVESDECMGECQVPIGKLGLAKGGGGKVADYPLAKGKGQVKLMFAQT